MLPVTLAVLLAVAPAPPIGPGPRDAAAGVPADLSAATVVRPEARVETEPVPHKGDAADTPAIWVHPTDAGKSLVLGTDKKGALIVYDLDGRERQRASDGSRPNDVDVLYDFVLGGQRCDLALAGCRGPDAMGVKVWRVDPDQGLLTDVTAGGIIPVFGGAQPYGSCVYRSPRSGDSFFFVTTMKGQVEQYRLEDAGGGKVSAARVRGFSVGSICEGCVADPELGTYYLSEERVGIWKFGAEPDAGDQRALVAKVGEHGLTADVEGLTLYCATGGKGYLIASSQGSSTFNVYTREGDNRYVLTIDPRPGGIDDVDHTDGVAVTNRPLSSRFPQGLFVAQDGRNRPLNQNFKLYGWEDIAGQRLLADTDWSPRIGGGPAPAVAMESPPAGGDPSPWAVEAQPLEVETARVAPPGAVRLEVGFELQGGTRQVENRVPIALDYAAFRRVTFRLEPILYSRVAEGSRRLADGFGDLELGATVLAWPASGRNPGVALGAEVKLPTATSRLIGSGRADYTGDLILSKRVATLDLHLNLGYTLVGSPPGLHTRNVTWYAVAVERRFARYDLVAELRGHTAALTDGSDPDAAGATRPLAAELAGERRVATLGVRYHLMARTMISLGLSYDDDHALQVHPGLGVRLR